MQLGNQIGSGPCTKAFGPDANTLWGLPSRPRTMVGAEGQEASHANSSHWESRLLQGHLYRRPDLAHWKVGRGEGAGRGGDMWREEGARGWMTRTCLRTFKPVLP